MAFPDIFSDHPLEEFTLAGARTADDVHMSSPAHFGCDFHRVPVSVLTHKYGFHYWSLNRSSTLRRSRLIKSVYLGYAFSTSSRAAFSSAMVRTCPTMPLTTCSTLAGGPFSVRHLSLSWSASKNRLLL